MAVTTKTVALNVSGNLTLDDHFWVEGTSGDLKVTSTGTIDGNGYLYLADGCSLSQMDGSIENSRFYIRKSHNDTVGAVVPAQYNSTRNYIHATSGGEVFEFSSGNYTFAGDLEILAEVAAVLATVLLEHVDARHLPHREASACMTANAHSRGSLLPRQPHGLRGERGDRHF